MSFIVKKVTEYMQSQIQQWPCTSNRASEVGHPCERYLVFGRTRWQEKTMHNVSLQFIFNEGNVQEKAVLDLLSAAGITVIEQQRAFAWNEHNLTGHIDGKLLVDGEAIPLEIKSMSPFIFDKINTVDDLLNGKYDHLKKYPAQLTLYMLMDNKERALFLFKNKANGQLKEILMPLDYDYAERLIQKIERVNKAIAGKAIPEPLEWCDTCENCGFKHICLNDVIRKEIEFRIDPEAEDKIDGWFELRQWSDKWKDLDEWRKEHFRGVEKLVIGPYLILGKSIGKDKAGWKISIQKLGGNA